MTAAENEAQKKENREADAELIRDLMEAYDLDEEAARELVEKLKNTLNKAKQGQ